jgi:hypothetical protein
MLLLLLVAAVSVKAEGADTTRNTLAFILSIFAAAAAFLLLILFALMYIQLGHVQRTMEKNEELMKKAIRLNTVSVDTAA